MTQKTISDKAQTFTYTFKDTDTAMAASHAILGYLVGTNQQEGVENTIQGTGELIVSYVNSFTPSETFTRICDSFKDYNQQHGTEDNAEGQYLSERVEQLKQSESWVSSLEKVARLELALMALSDSVLDDEYPEMAFNTVHGSLEALDDEAMSLLKGIDTEGEYKALWQYAE